MYTYYTHISFILKIFDLHTRYRITFMRDQERSLLLFAIVEIKLKQQLKLPYVDTYCEILYRIRGVWITVFLTKENAYSIVYRKALRRTHTRRGVAEIMLVYYSRFVKISCTRNRYDLQSAGETGSLVPQQRRLGRPAHQDQLLVGQHHHAGKSRKPHSQVNETLVTRLIVIYRYESHSYSLLINKCLKVRTFARTFPMMRDDTAYRQAKR